MEAALLLGITDLADWGCTSQTCLYFSLPTCLFLFVNFNFKQLVPTYDETEQNPAGAEIDVYLPASFLITFITVTSSSPGTGLMHGFSESDKIIR